MNRIDECILYRNFEQQEVLNNFSTLISEYNHKKELGEEKPVLSGEAVGLFYSSLNLLCEMANQYGFYGNLWHDYLTFLLVNKENAFSTSCEVVGHVEGSINSMAEHDFVRFKELYDFDVRALGECFSSGDAAIICDYENTVSSKKLFNKRISESICALSRVLSECRDVHEFQDAMTGFYQRFGCGKLGLHKAFRIGHTRNGEVVIEPITNIANVQLSDLVGYEREKQKLIDNTEAFIRGRKANNCLLYGDAGTGKSSSIKGILNMYYEQGLRIIEVYKHQFQDLNEVIRQIKNRNYKFIIYMDDLSFEEFETEYKYLKAVIEGGLELKPDNILIYATSNRRHLIRETYKDKEDEDMHTGDTVQEKLSLVHRFGVQIYFGKPDKKMFQTIVKALAERSEIDIPQDQLLLEANKWELSHGGFSGRTAQQFIDYLLGFENPKEH